MYVLKQMILIDTKNLFKNKAWLVLSIGLQVILVGLLGFITKPLYGDLISSFDYYGITIFLFAAANASSFAANAFLEEKIKKPNLRVIYSSTPDYMIPISKIFAGFLFTIISYLISGVVVKILFQVNYGGLNFWKVFVLFLVFDFFACTVGVFVCCLVRNESIANQINSLVITILAILGSFFFNISSISQTLGKWSAYLPFSKLKELVFAVIYDLEATSILGTTLFLFITSLVLLTISCITFKGDDYL